MIERPIIIIGAPRSGTTILTRCLSLHPDLWHLSRESHHILEGPFHPGKAGFDSNRVSAAETTEEICNDLTARFYRCAINLNRVMTSPAGLLSGNSIRQRLFNKVGTAMLGRLSAIAKPATIRFLEKTPKNTLRIPMLDRLFPDARFIHIRRKPAPNIASLVAGWHASDRVGPVVRSRYARAGYPIAGGLNLADYHEKWWKFALVPQWRGLEGKTVADVAAWQYYQCNRFALSDLAEMSVDRVFSVHYEAFVKAPARTVEQICKWADLPPSSVVGDFAAAMPRVNESAPRRAGRGLPYDSQVRSAMARLPQIRQLEIQMGYDGVDSGE